MARCGKLGVDYLVAHIGSHMGKGSLVGVRNVVEACNEALDANPNPTTILLENMAGQKNCVGARFEELRMILDGVKQKDRIGVCFDTCHAFAAGFDLSTRAGVEGRWSSSIPDRRTRRASRSSTSTTRRDLSGGNLDRHEHVGMGTDRGEGLQGLPAPLGRSRGCPS